VISAALPAWPHTMGLKETEPPGWASVLGLLLLIAVVVGGGIGVGIYFFAGLVAGVVSGCVAALGVVGGVLLAAPKLCAWSLGCRVTSQGEAVSVRNMAEAVSASMGVEVAEILVADVEGIGTASFGRSSRRAYLVVTAGLERRLSLVELEAALAHELAHIRARHVGPDTLRSATIGLVGLVWPSLTKKLLARRWPLREASADAISLAVTRYPPALRSCLAKCQADPVPLTRRRQLLAGHLWVVPSNGVAAGIDWRMAALEEA
jgi:hypothetical protein